MKAAIFDFDGVIVDSYESALQAYRKLFRDLGYEFRQKYLKQNFGKGPRTVIQDYIEGENLPFDDQQITELVEKKSKLNLEFSSLMKIQPGVKELLEILKRQSVAALATTNISNFVVPYLEKSALKKYFKAILTREDIIETKPNPELFLKAAEKIQKNPEECVVFEDAVAGVQAARNAGMKCIAVITGQTAKEDLKKENSDLLVDSLKEIDKIMEVLK